MKKILTSLLTLTLTASLCLAGFRVPKSVYTMDDLEKAKTEAASEGKSLLILYSDPSTTWGPCITASVAAIKAFKSKGVLVFANTKSEEDRKRLPKGVSQVRKEAGNTIPMLFALSADGEKGIKGLSYSTLKSDTRKAARELGKTLEDLKADAELAAAEAAFTKKVAPKKPPLLAKSQLWTNAEGKTIRAAVISVDSKNVVFLMRRNSQVTYPLSKLSTESQEKLKAMQE